jgi:hypothetical protein
MAKRSKSRHESDRDRRFARYRREWGELARIGSAMTDASERADPAARQQLERQYAGQLAEVRRLQAAG